MNKIQNEKWVNALPDEAVSIAEEINIEIAKVIAERIKTIGELSASDIKKLTNSLEYLGADFDKITKLIAKYSGKGQQVVVDTLKEVADANDEFAKTFYSAKDIAANTWHTDRYLHTLVESMARQTAAEFTNLSQTLAYKVDERYIPLRQMYSRAIDKAIYEVQSGTVDYHTTMRKTVRDLATGLRVKDSALVVDKETGEVKLHWESGYSRRLDSHVRQNLIDGVKQLQGQMLDYHGEKFGSDGVELSAHAISAPDHLPVQGRQFSNEEFFKLQTAQDFEDVKGNEYKAILRPIGQWNCRHVRFPIIIGISEPVHSEEQLKEFAENSKKKYDLTQKQRAMETKLRSLKTQRLAASAAGDELEAKRLQRKINEQQTIYRRFSEKHGLLYDTQRASVEGYRRISVKNVVKPLENSGESGILNDSENNIIKITQENIDAIPIVKTNTISEQLAFSLQNRHKEVLEVASKLPDNTEVGMVCDINGNMIKTVEGEHGKGNVKLPKLEVPYIVIHNHPSGKMHSHTDLQKLLFNENQIISSVVGNNGKIYLFKKTDNFDSFKCYEAYYNNALPKFEEAIAQNDLASYFKIMDKLIKECKEYGVEFIVGTNQTT